MCGTVVCFVLAKSFAHDLFCQRDAPVSEFHEVQRVYRAANEEQLHDGVVQADIVCEEVDVSRQKDDEVENLRFEADSST